MFFQRQILWQNWKQPRAPREWRLAMFFRLSSIAILAVLIPSLEVAQIQRVMITPQIAKLRPLTDDQKMTLASIRVWSEGYMRSLPDYICISDHEAARQPTGLNSWPMSDEVRQAVTWSGHRETYEILSVNGKSVHKELRSLGGNFSTGEFGTILDRLLGAESAAEFGYERRTTLRGVPVDVSHTRFPMRTATRSTAVCKATNRPGKD